MNADRLFQNSASRWDRFEELTGPIMANLRDVSNRIEASDKYETDVKLAKLEEMQACALELRKIDAEAKARSTALKEMNLRLQNESLRNEPIEDFMGLYKQGATAAKNVKNNSRFAKDPDVVAVGDLIKKITNVQNGEDDDVAVDTAVPQHVTRCPILNSELVNPVKNSNCGHVYSLKGAISLLYQENAPRSRAVPNALPNVPQSFVARCPSIGCSATLTPATLKRDYATELTQRQMNASMRKDSLDAEVEIL